MDLIGECNGCGLCCVGGPHSRCENLLVLGDLGKPSAGLCAVYGVRYDGMPIRMVDRDRNTVASVVCHKGCGEEASAIVSKGLGRGCSLRLG